MSTLRGGYLLNSDATSGCTYCPMEDSNMFLRAYLPTTVSDGRISAWGWRFIVFNVAASLFLYWLGRVPNKNKGKKQMGLSL